MGHTRDRAQIGARFEAGLVGGSYEKRISRGKSLRVESDNAGQVLFPRPRLVGAGGAEGRGGGGADQAQGEVLVTPPKRSNFETWNEARDCPFFVDWLSLSQHHEEPLPRVDAGCVLGVDADGVLVWKVERARKLLGSYETSVQVRCDGHRVTFDGNVSRFGRPSNLFGFGLAEALRRVNDVLAELGLPPFTWGRRFLRPDRNGDVREQWTGARLRRIDLTANYAAGSARDARAYMDFLATQQHSARVKVGTQPDGGTIDWGRGSRRLYAKVYDKAAEMRRHGAPATHIGFADEMGVVRFELTVKANQLLTMGCQFLGSLDMGQLIALFDERRAVMTRADHDHDDLESLPNAFRRTARDYLAGDDMTSRMSRTTFWRHRRALLPYGIDIAVPRNVFEFKPRVRVIELRALTSADLAQFESRQAA